MDLTVVLCTRNRRASLLQTLETLRAQVADAAWEVLVVDNGSEDGTGAAVQARADGFPVPLRLVEEPEPGLSHARNRALAAATGRALLFLDDDVNCLPGCVAAHAAALARPDVVGTAGRILPLLPSDAPAWWRELLPREVGGPTSRYDFGDTEREITACGGLPLPFGANMGVLLEVARAVGGFRTDLGWGRRLVPCEETEFFRRVLAGGGRLLYLPAARVEHRIESRRTTLAYYRRWHRGYGRATILMERRRSPLQRLRRCRRDLRDCVRARLRSLIRVRRGDLAGALAELRAACIAEGRILQSLGL